MSNNDKFPDTPPIGGKLIGGPSAAKAMIGDQEVEYFTQPGMAVGPGDAGSVAPLMYMHNGLIHALIREAIDLRTKLGAISAEMSKLRKQVDTLMDEPIDARGDGA